MARPPRRRERGGTVTIGPPGDGRRIYLIRHGKADRRSMREAETPRGPAADPPLDETGRKQVQALAKRLRRMPAPAAILCSTLTRARETIAPFVGLTGAEVEYRDDIVEWFGGEWEFKEFEELLVEHPEIPQRILFQDPLFHLAPGGEPFTDFQQRCVDAIESALASHDDGDLWVVCHGGVINAYVGWVLRVEEQEMFFLPPNTSINTIRVHGDLRALWFLADDTHVTEPGLFPDGFPGDPGPPADEGPPGAVLD
jgi:2,3-bisphosphoglycerate-dependent phosphoglycerate mutase